MHAADLGIATALLGSPGGEAGGELEDVEQALRRGIEHHELVVKAQGVLDVEQGDGAHRLHRRGGGGKFLAGLTDRTDRGADAAAILERRENGTGTQGGLGLGEVGIGGDVAQVHFLGAAEDAIAFQVDVGVAEDRAVLGHDDVVDGVADGLHLGADDAAGDDLGGALGGAVGGLEVGLGGGVGAVDDRIQVGEDDLAVGVEVDHQPAEVGELGVGGDDQSGLAVGPGRHDREAVGGDEIGIVAVEGHGHVVGITEALVAATGHHHINTLQQGGKRLVALQGVELIDHHNLVDTPGAKHIDGSLHIEGHFLEITGGGIGVVLRHGAVGGALAQQVEGGSTDDADLLAPFGDDGVGRDLALDGAGLLAREGVGGAAADAGVGESPQGTVSREVEVGGDERELGAGPGATGGEGALQDRRAQVELVVTQG